MHTYARTTTPQALLENHFTTMEWVRALSDIGIQVTVFYRFSENHQLSIDGVNFHFIADRLPPALKAYHLAYDFHKKVAQCVKENNIKIIHAHNPFALLPNFVLRKLIPRCKMLIQDHSGRLSLNRTLLLKIALNGVDAVVFASKGQEQPWLESNILTKEQCHFVMENASPFKFVERNIARKKTNLSGHPIFLWVGNLDANKDPYTALAAFGKYVNHVSTAHLFMIYRLVEHENEIQQYIEQDDTLSSHVTMLGGKTRADLEVYYNSADYIISASHKEGSGFTIIEAMSCGVIPIVTRIPSFLALTGNGKIGILYDSGNHEMLYDKLIETIDQDITSASTAALDHFEEYFSFSAMANNMKTVYLQLIRQRD